uniref:Calcineurin-like phosphoesterase domain-containing protein n=1 Tax=uncultured Armatimonadetes bacterium TaxID=157466 RepID=A0A6J4J5I5_9BACT|nr:hypothetical protein AVDCRST_MAG63-2884 [uncultured Armatimonadetes bacterium]
MAATALLPPAETWALLADVHGNLPALERALVHVREAGAATRLAFLGDVLGGAQDEVCCRRLMEQADIALFGNRELTFLASAATRKAPPLLPPDVIEWLRGLRATARLGPSLLCHSSPASALPADITAEKALEWRRDHRHLTLFPFILGPPSALAAARALGQAPVSAVFFGHTHRQGAWVIRDGAAERLTDAHDVPLDEGTTIVGIGAVGQGEAGRVEFALYTPDAGRVRLVRLP